MTDNWLIYEAECLLGPAVTKHLDLNQLTGDVLTELGREAAGCS